MAFALTNWRLIMRNFIRVFWSVLTSLFSRTAVVADELTMVLEDAAKSASMTSRSLRADLIRERGEGAFEDIQLLSEYDKRIAEMRS